MKRSHQEIASTKPRSEPLGALEFASAVNGDDARAVLLALRRFTRTIQRQRKQALTTTTYSDDESSSEEDDSSSDEEGDEAMDEANTRKKKREEAWMEDTESFNVPFVGTSVAKGDTGTVVRGQWPTGLLQSYLKASPMAVELSGTDLLPPSGHVHKRLLSKRTKLGKKTSQAIYRAYLEALAEVVTAHVPIPALQTDLGVPPDQQQQQQQQQASTTTLTATGRDGVISVILRNHLTELMALISQETGGGKLMDKALVAPALKVLANLSATSLGVAREVTRALDASLKDGILKSLLRSRKNTDKEERGDEDGVRVQCLRLATVLLEWKDAAITSYITTKGSRERKINAGIVYLALRLGLHDSVFEHGSEQEDEDDGDSDDYVEIVARLLRAVRGLLPEANRGGAASRRPLLSTRDLVDLFASEALIHISQIAIHAPPLTDYDSYLQIVAGSDVGMDSVQTPLEEAGVESQRILFSLLADPERSPFLSRINNSKHDDKLAAQCAQQLVRAMMLLLQRRPSLAMQQFLIQCLQTTPKLVPHFFKMITVPDPKQQTFPFVARMGFLFRLLRQAPTPSPADCIASSGRVDSQDVDEVVASIIPQNLKKHILSKALQSSNALIASETLKLLCALIDRYRLFLTDAKVNAGEELHILLTDAFIRRLPDMQPLLSVRSRFDPFTEEDGAKASTVVIGHVCNVLNSYALNLPQVLHSVKFDWTKLLPTSAETFCSASPVLQFQLLQTLENVLALHEEHTDRHRMSAAALQTVLEIMMVTTRSKIHQKARAVALQTIRSPSLKTADSETRECIEYETSLFVDGLTRECIDELCSLFNSPANNGFQHGLAVAKAWKRTGFDAGLPSICFSPLLSTSVQTRHPLPLASLIANGLADIDVEVSSIKLLSQYAQGLVAPDDWHPEERVPLLASLSKSLFSPDCLQNVLMRGLENETNLDLCRVQGFSDMDIKAAVRHCLHVSVLASASSDLKQNIAKLRTLVALVDQNQSVGDTRSHFDVIFEHPLLSSDAFPWTELAYLKTAALSASGDTTTMLSNVIDVAHLEEDDASCNAYSFREILLLSLLNPLLPNQVSTRAMREILRRLCQAATMRSPLVLSSYASLGLYWMDKHQDQEPSSFVPLDAALEAWQVLVESSATDDYATPLMHCLEALLSKALESRDSESASLLYSLFLKSPSTETVQACIRSKEAAYGTPSSTSTVYHCPSLLSSLIVADPCLFGRSFLKNLAQSTENNNVYHLLEEGVFDEELAVLSRRKELLSTEDFARVQDAVVKRALEALPRQSEMQRGARKGRNVEEGLVSLLAVPGMFQAGNLDAFVNRAYASLKLQANPNTADKRWLELSHVILCGSENSEETLHESNTKRLLSSTVLIRALQMLRSTLKSHFKSNTSDPQTESGHACLEALNRVLVIAKKRLSYDEAMLTREGSRAVTDAIKASLKYGLTHTLDQDSGISEHCFQVIRALLVEALDPSSTLHSLKNLCMLLDPSTILALILSHSHFNEFMTSQVVEEEEATGRNTVLELVRLLLVCTSMSRETVLFESGALATILAAYNAGTTLLDITLRRLLDVYAGALSDRNMELDLPLLETMKWKGIARDGDASMKTPGWDWLANGLDTARIRSTLSQFPVHDRMKADPIRDVEVWLEDSSKANQTHENNALSTRSDSSTSEDSDVSMEDGAEEEEEEEEEEEDAVEIEKNRHTVDVDKWTGSGDDTRYSPAFILPLILAGLENSLSKSNLAMNTHGCDPSSKYERNNEGNEEQDESPAVKEFVLLAQRLCEKGAFSLALGSLCSECSSLRKVAVATLGHMKKALDTKEARSLSTWRERPQLAMIVDSVQRGLAVRIALRTDPHGASSNVHVPKLPALTAVFLARAALIIVKPGDPMFGPMNRYFLRLDNGHGAFQDTNRIPAFISLFCSSADEPGQARRERMWALQLLRDSFVEEYCYRHVESCHAPELLLTSFGSIDARQEDDQHAMERILLLDTLASLLDNGGRQATSHLIGRLGLLSWLRGQCVAGDLVHLLPSIESRSALLRLVFKAVSMARLHLANESSDRYHLMMESMAFINHIVTLYNDSVSHGSGLASERKDSTPPASFATETSKTLSVLVGIVHELGSSEDLGDVQQSGICLAEASQMLQTIPQDLKQMAVSSLCLAPFRHDAESDESIAMFSELVLAFFSKNEVDADTSTAVLRRVTLLMPLLERPLDGCELLAALLGCRHRCLRSCREEWFDCLEAVVGMSASSPTETLRISKAILQAGQ